MKACSVLCVLGVLLAATSACKKPRVYKLIGLPVCQVGEAGTFAGRYELIYQGTELGIQTLTGQGKDALEVRSTSDEIVVALVSCAGPSATPSGKLDEHDVPTVCPAQTIVWQGRLKADASDVFHFPKDFPKATTMRCQLVPNR